MSETRNCSKFYEFKPTGCNNKETVTITMSVVTECVYRSFLDCLSINWVLCGESPRGCPFRNAPGPPAQYFCHERWQSHVS